MESLLGIIFHSIGGFSSGSFYMPFKKVKNWAWESYWLIGGFFSWLIVPPIAAYLTIPNFTEIIATAAPQVKALAFIMGLIWGVGGLTYGLGVRYLGMSLGNSITLGFCSAFGALIPPIYYHFNAVEGKESISDMFANSGGQMVLAGVLICILGIAILGKAGMLKEKDFATGHEDKDKDFNLVKGLIIAIVSGILSSFFNFGIEAAKPMAEVANEAWKLANPNQGEFLFQNNVSYIVILWGGLTTNFIWCIYLNFKNKTFSDYTNINTPIAKNVLFSAIAGTMWFLQFFFYGMGESKLGNGASSWILHMSTIILTANFWGFYLKEWTGVSKKTMQTFVWGIGLIMLSIVVVGIGNSL
ncbi:L-rhamnose/proton symporter RhaT [Flavobacterium sp. KACC 22761]|uniref:L-rhamnose/proton symporter RhaT n=1 Tax=Flavobacterium sp. KACC 22761 TaxID=3092665 RepID=UPI002A756B75|nr:L-rhamnose/proton symporter RhaT [Flavobacterium sp. KACC 22761]WPO78442.1 L-rhamnose/proton symporter RhaT [Flavobacterium sp. KACC 22761]